MSGEFDQFCASAGIKHLTTAPFHPSSNGEAERWVRTFKVAMKKALLEGKSKVEALDTLLFTYRTTPGVNGKSPSELLHGRQPRTALSLLRPTTAENRIDGEPRFKVGDTVHVKFFSGSPWEIGIVKKVRGRMLYQLQTPRGVVQRHQNQLRKAKAPTSIMQQSADTALPNLDPPAGVAASGPTTSEQPEATIAAERMERSESSVVPSLQSKRSVTFQLPDGPRRSARIHRPPSRYQS